MNSEENNNKGNGLVKRRKKNSRRNYTEKRHLNQPCENEFFSFLPNPQCKHTITNGINYKLTQSEWLTNQRLGAQTYIHTFMCVQCTCTDIIDFSARIKRFESSACIATASILIFLTQFPWHYPHTLEQFLQFK